MCYVTAGQDLSMTRSLLSALTWMNSFVLVSACAIDRQKNRQRQNVNGGRCKCAEQKGRQHVKWQCPNEEQWGVRKKGLCEELWPTQHMSVTVTHRRLLQPYLKGSVNGRWLFQHVNFYWKCGKSADEMEEKECVSQSSFFNISVLIIVYY